jgi:hypothetical protein
MAAGSLGKGDGDERDRCHDPARGRYRGGVAGCFRYNIRHSVPFEAVGAVGVSTRWQAFYKDPQQVAYWAAGTP